jgi:hypothetical protein
MVLATAYMRRTNSVRPDVERRARENIEVGYQRLLGFEVTSEPGGFDWWGKPPANLFLTAYALLEFRAMAEVYPVDPALLARIAKWLLDRQQADGSWTPAGERATWSADFARGRSQILTAYVAWGLARAGAPSAKATAWLEAHADATQDPYGLALTALALLTADPASRVGQASVDRLVKLLTEDDRGILWRPEGETNIGARGDSATVETTALAIQALLAGGRHPGLASRALDRLAAWRGPDGRFGTTQSTILALEALLAASGASAGDDGDVTVDDGRGGSRRLRVGPSTVEPVHVDLGTGDAGPVGMTIGGDARVRVAVTRTSWVPWDRTRERRGRLALAVAWPTEVLKVGPRYDATVTIANPTPDRASVVTLEIGIPPGCDVEPTDVRGAGLERVERAETAVVLYLRDLAGGASRTFKVGFRPRYGLDVVTAPSKAYEYYVPEEAVEVGPQPVRARR